MSEMYPGQSELESKMISEQDEEMNNFYHQMQLSPNPSFNNLDGCLFERYYTNSNLIKDNANAYATPYKVKNILACYQEENYDSRNDLDAIPSNQIGCDSILKKSEQQFNSPSPSSMINRNQGETSSPFFESFHQQNDLANELSSTEKFDFFDIGEQNTYKQKLNYTIDIEDFMLNCVPHPFSIEAQKGAEKVFINKRIGEMKKKKLITKRLFNKYQLKNDQLNIQQLSSYPFNGDSDINDIPVSEHNTNPHKILKKDEQTNENQSKIEEEIYNHSSSCFEQKDIQQVSQANPHKVQDTNSDQQQLENISFQDRNKTNGKLKMSSIPCKCRKSLCLKLYCECFARGEICGPACICLECRNSTSYLEHRNNAIKQIESKNPTAFLYASATAAVSSNQDSTSIRTFIEQSQLLAEVRRGCNCKKSKCRKKYCECYMVGKQCTSLCQCVDCTNNVPHSHSPSSTSQSLPLQPESSLSQQKFTQLNQNEIVLSKGCFHQSDSSEISNCDNQNDQSLPPLLKDFNKLTDYKEEKKRNNKLSSQLKQINISQTHSSNISKVNNCGQKKTLCINHQMDIQPDQLHDQKLTTISTFQLSCKENKFNMKAKKIIKAKKTSLNNFQ